MNHGNENEIMEICDIAVVEAGPAGCMTSIRGSQLGENVTMERN